MQHFANERGVELERPHCAFVMAASIGKERMLLSEKRHHRQEVSRCFKSLAIRYLRTTTRMRATGNPALAPDVQNTSITTLAFNSLIRPAPDEECNATLATTTDQKRPASVPFLDMKAVSRTLPQVPCRLAV